MANKTSKRRSRRTEKPIVSTQDWDRRHLPGMSLHESEKLLIGLLTLLLLYLPWALGSTHFWTQAGACLLAAASFGAALLPRHGDTHSVTSAGQFKRLVTFPVFWLGLLLLAYVAAQGLNPAWKMEGAEGLQLLEESEHISSLPAGVAAEESNPLRWLLILGAPFLAVCAAWVGITRRKSIHFLLAATGLNGFLIAGMGFYQIAKHKTEILWFYEPPTQSFLSTFPYHWQGAAYLTVVMAAVLGLAAHHYARARKTFTRSNPSGLFVFVGLVLMLIIIFSGSQATATVAGAIMVAFLAHIGYRELTKDDAPFSRKAFLTALSLVVIGVGGVIAGNLANDYIERKARNPDLELAIAPEGTWTASNQIGAAMLRERPLYGWGAGSFPHVYQNVAEREEINSAPVSLEIEYAAGDWIRLPAELGIAGTILLLLIFGYLAKHFLHARTLQNPLVTFLLLGVVAGLVLGIANLTFQNGAFFTTWSLVLAFGAILIRIEGSARSRLEVGAEPPD